MKSPGDQAAGKKPWTKNKSRVRTLTSSAAKPAAKSPEQLGMEAALRVLSAGGRVPAKFVPARPTSAGPTAAEAEAQAKLTPARRVAFEILTLVEAGKGHSDELLHGVRTQDLSEADRHLATALVMGVLRWSIALDARVKKLLERPEEELEAPVALVLRLGAFQLLHMDRIPAHAALSESVEMTRAAGHPHAAGMVNAVLRKVAAAKKPGARVFESTAAFAERLGHPRWLVERWVAAYGREAALKICEAGQREAGQREAGLFAGEGELPAGFPVMDDGSRLVAELTARAMPEGGLRVWDCCAAPGGKTLVLAARLGGAEIVATDISTKRLGPMQARFRRAGVEIQSFAADALKLPEPAGEFDLILCDVPCSGTGTLGRNPEIRLLLKPEELTRQAERQVKILAAALGRLKPGGRLVYSTCSLEPEENERVLAVVGAGFRRVPVDSFLPEMNTGLAPMVVDGNLRTLPGVHPCDGFFAAVLERA